MRKFDFLAALGVAIRHHGVTAADWFVNPARRALAFIGAAKLNRGRPLVAVLLVEISETAMELLLKFTPGVRRTTD